MAVKTAPKKKLAPGKYTGEFLEVAYAKRLFINSGPTTAVRLVRLVNAPCNAPCSFAGTCEEIIPCMDGPPIPPRQQGTKNTIIQKPDGANPKRIKPIVENAKPMYIDLFAPKIGLTFRIKNPWTKATNAPTTASEYPTSAGVHLNLYMV